MIPDNQSNRRKGDRNPKNDPVIHRDVIYLNNADNACFLALYDKSCMSVKSYFITFCIFNKPIKVVKIDKAVQDYCMSLTTFFGQFRMVGTNYNQIEKALKSNFSEKKALVFLYKLEKETIEMLTIQKKIMELTDEFEKKFEIHILIIELIRC